MLEKSISIVKQINHLIIKTIKTKPMKASVFKYQIKYHFHSSAQLMRYFQLIRVFKFLPLSRLSFPFRMRDQFSIPSGCVCGFHPFPYYFL